MAVFALVPGGSPFLSVWGSGFFFVLAPLLVARALSSSASGGFADFSVCEASFIARNGSPSTRSCSCSAGLDRPARPMLGLWHLVVLLLALSGAPHAPGAAETPSRARPPYFSRGTRALAFPPSRRPPPEPPPALFGPAAARTRAAHGPAIAEDAPRTRHRLQTDPPQATLPSNLLACQLVLPETAILDARSSSRAARPRAVLLQTKAQASAGRAALNSAYPGPAAPPQKAPRSKRASGRQRSPHDPRRRHAFSCAPLAGAATPACRIQALCVPPLLGPRDSVSPSQGCLLHGTHPVAVCSPALFFHSVASKRRDTPSRPAPGHIHLREIDSSDTPPCLAPPACSRSAPAAPDQQSHD